MCAASVGSKLNGEITTVFVQPMTKLELHPSTNRKPVQLVWDWSDAFAVRAAEFQ